MSDEWAAIAQDAERRSREAVQRAEDAGALSLALEVDVQSLERRVADLQAECARLAGERETENALASESTDLILEAHELRRDVATLRAALARYGRHDPECAALTVPLIADPCDCGLRAALENR